MVISECERCHKTLYYDPPQPLCRRCRDRRTGPIEAARILWALLRLLVGR